MALHGSSFTGGTGPVFVQVIKAFQPFQPDPITLLPSEVNLKVIEPPNVEVIIPGPANPEYFPISVEVVEGPL